MKSLRGCPSHLLCWSAPNDQSHNTITWPFAKTVMRVGALAVLMGAFNCSPNSTLALAQTTQTDNAAVDPDAVDAVKKMGVYLRSLKSFQVIDDISTDDVLED